MIKKDKVIILKKVKYSESDLVIHCLNSHGEKINFLAKGALKSKKRFGGGTLEPTHYVQVTYKSRGEQTEALNFLQEASLINGFEGLRTSYDKIELALYFVSLVAKVSQEGDVGNEQNFNLLGNALKLLEVAENYKKLKTVFELKFLYFQGILPPELSHKSFMNKKLQDYEQLEASPQELNDLRSRAIQALNQYHG